MVKLPLVLWILWTTLTQSINFMPFFLVYGSDVVLIAYIAYGALRVTNFDLLEEVREMAATRSAKYQQVLRPSHDDHVHLRFFNVGNLVLRQEQTTKADTSYPIL